MTAPAYRHGWRFWLALAIGIVLGAPLVLVGLLLIALNTGPGDRAVMALVGSASGGTVELAGLHGGFPDAPRLDRLTLRDRQGVWLTANGVALDWSAPALLGWHLHLRRARIARLVVSRLPVATMPARPAQRGGFGLPMALSLDRLALDEIDLGPALLGVPARLTAEGAARLRGADNAMLSLALRDLDRGSRYAIAARLDGASVDAHLDAHEPASGLAAAIAHVPDPRGLALTASLEGPRAAAVLQVSLGAGQLQATAAGSLDLVHRAADVAVRAAAPALSFGPGLGWRQASLAAHVIGPWARPAGSGTLSLTGVSVNGATLAGLVARFGADTNTASLDTTLTGLDLPPPNRTLLAGTPMQVQARMRLDAPGHPVSYNFTDGLITGGGNAVLGPRLHATLAATIADLSILARARGRDVQGHAGFTLTLAGQDDGAMRADLDAAMDITGGADAPAAARGHSAMGGTVTLHGDDLVLSRCVLASPALHLDATGTRHAGLTQARWHLAVEDLAALAPAVRGAAMLDGRLAGTDGNLALDATVTGRLGTAGPPAFAPAPLSLVVHATGLPAAPAGSLDAEASLLGAPLSLSATATRGLDGALGVTIGQAQWRSAHLAGALALTPGAALPTGTLDLGIGRLDDLRPLLGRPLTGAVTARLRLPAGGRGDITLTALNAGLAGRVSVARAALQASIADPARHPVVAGTLTLTGLRAGGAQGDLRLGFTGPAEALALTLDATQAGGAGTGHLVASATLDAARHRLALSRLVAQARGIGLALQAPAVLSYAPVVAVDRLVLSATAAHAAPATLTLRGRISPSLDLEIAVAGLTPDLARVASPGLDVAGTLAAQAHLTGSAAAPVGTLMVIGRGFKARTGAGQAMPAADVTARVLLAGGVATVDLRLVAGTARLGVAGSVGLAGARPVALMTQGQLDLALFDPTLGARGQRLRGQLDLVARIGGTLAAPAARGALHLAGGEVQDFVHGVHLTGVTAALQADGDRLEITQFSATAGNGTLTAGGEIGLQPPRAVRLRITARNARAVSSDLVTATLDADIVLDGSLAAGVAASGRIFVHRADIQVPDRLPASVPVLDVRRAGAPPPPPVAPGPALPLDLVVDAPQRIFVRGRGLDAELGGTVQVHGTAAAPRIGGAIDLRQGSYSLAGQSLSFTSGTIGFDGARGIDPSLDLVATASDSDLVATLTVGGYASAPKITLTSVPDRPQDEVLAALLFHQSAASLSPFQLAEVAAGLAQLSGLTGGGPDPLSRLRKGLGLDRLSLGSSGTGTTTTTTLEAGRYVAPGVFVGAKQGIGGSQTAAEVQIDLTRRLKLNTTAGSGTGSNSLGLTYQFQY